MRSTIKTVVVVVVVIGVVVVVRKPAGRVVGWARNCSRNRTDSGHDTQRSRTPAIANRERERERDLTAGGNSAKHANACRALFYDGRQPSFWRHRIDAGTGKRAYTPTLRATAGTKPGISKRFGECISAI